MKALSTIFAACILSLASVAAEKPADVDAKGYRRAVAPREWSFPRDHGRHDGFKTEWWYVTGHLRERGTGRRFGYQFTIFRSAMTAVPVPRASKWGMTDLYLLHVAVSDFGAGTFHRFDDLQRARPGVAWSADDTLDVALLDAALKLDGDALRLTQTAKIPNIDLILAPSRRPVLQGEGGLNQKGPALGQASYYYSWTRLKTRGTLTLVDGKPLDVEGDSWMDHEFSSNPLSPTQAGWDWLSLHLKDGSDLMLYRLRDAAGKTDYLSGSRTDATGQTAYLRAQDITMEPSDVWRSPNTGASYPQRWNITVKGMQPITVRSLMKEQEWSTPDTTNVDYFEGGVDALDDKDAVVGQGYLEMTGSVKTMAGR